MVKKKEEGKRKKPAARKKPKHYVRAGETIEEVFNSGTDVWLYDEANRDAIRLSGAMNMMGDEMPEEFTAMTKRGMIVGYSLLDDDPLRVGVIVGDLLTEREMSVARWLEPQRAFLQLPSGKLCVESDDASRIGPEEPSDPGAVVNVPPGNYRLTLYRIDHEAMRRDRLKWKGPQEVVVLTPGGTAADAAEDVLPFRFRRDLSWIGKYKIAGKRAEGLAWLPNYWDTFMVNLDRTAADQLGLVPGAYFRTTVPAADISFVSVFGHTPQDMYRLPHPVGLTLDEFGFATLYPIEQWGSQEVLYCRRDRTKKLVEDEYQNIWLPAIIEILDVAPEDAATAGPASILPSTKRTYSHANLSEKAYFEPGFLGEALSGVFPEAAGLVELLLPQAMEIADEAMKKLRLSPQGDFCYQGRNPMEAVEYTCRVYTGLPDCYGVLSGTEACIEVFFLSLLEDGTWIVTGFADDVEARLSRRPDRSNILLQKLDDGLPKVLVAHKKSLSAGKGTVQPAPKDFSEALATYEQFLAAVLD